MRTLFAAGYYLSWVGSAALLAYLPLALLWEGARLSQRSGIDDSVVVLSLPLGAALGVWAAIRTRRARKFRLVCLGVGVLLLISGILLSVSSISASERATGTGPFAGLGELIFAAMAMLLALFGACVAGIGLFGSLAKFPDERAPGYSKKV